MSTQKTNVLEYDYFTMFTITLECNHDYFQDYFNEYPVSNIKATFMESLGVEYLSHLRFADDIYICANIPHDLQQKLHELADEIDNQGLKMNKSKTKVMMETDTPIYVNNTQIENVESYVCLGQRYSTRYRYQEEARPDGQHSPSTATSSRVT